VPKKQGDYEVIERNTEGGIF